MIGLRNNHPAMSLWDVSAEEADVAAPLEGDASTDLAIVGGGITGLSTALHAAQKGIGCHVLEAEHVGYGGSGRNVGLVNAALWLPPQDLSSRLGPTYGPRFVQRFGEAPAYVFSLIERYQIRCEMTRTGTIHAAHAPKGYEDLARRAEEWRRLGAPVDLLSKEQVAEKIGSDRFYGGLIDHRAGTINPMGYVRGLARAARGEGATLATGTKVTGLHRQGDKWVLQTSRGRVTATAVVLGTNAYSDDLWPSLKRTFTMIHYFQVATKPLGDRVEPILKERQGLWSTGSIMSSIRRDTQGRLVVGSMGRAIGGETGISRRWAARRLAHMFPNLGPVEFETAWHGQIAMTPDHLPRIYELAERVYTPIGYNGRGITTGTLFGQAMAELLTTGDPADLPLPITELRTVASAPILERVYGAAFAANQILKSL